jgi:hypothetical protein
MRGESVVIGVTFAMRRFFGEWFGLQNRWGCQGIADKELVAGQIVMQRNRNWRKHLDCIHRL